MGDIALRTRVNLVYAGVNISQDVAPDALSLTYNDNEGGKSDDVSISLKNIHHKWNNAWLPARGDKIQVTIVQEGRGAGFDLPCGTFTVDEIEMAGPPSTFVINAISVPVDSDIFRRKRSRAWENVRLSEIAQDTANNGNLALLFLLEDDPIYDRRDQRDETDMAFLTRICKAEALSVKCTDEQLVIFSPEAQGNKAPVVKITYGKDNVKAYNFKAQSHDVYFKCIVEYVSPKTGKIVKYTYQQPDLDAGKIKKVTGRASSLAEAERRAKAALFEANRNEVTGTLSLTGDTRLVAGATVEIEGWGRFDGKYYIKKATHTVANGYTTSIELSNTRTPAKPGKPTVLTTKKTPPKEHGPDGLESILGK